MIKLASMSIRPKGVGKDLFDDLMGIKEDKNNKKKKSKTQVSKKPAKPWKKPKI